MDFEHDLLTVDEAAAYLRVHPATVRSMIKRGDIAAIRVGRIWRVEAASLKADYLPQPIPVIPALHSAAYYTQLAQQGRQHDAPPDSGRGR